MTSSHNYISLYVKIVLQKKYRVIGNGRNWCKKAREVRAHGEGWWQCWCREGGRFKINLRDGVKRA